MEDKGFTMLEMLIVLVVVSLIFFVLVVNIEKTIALNKINTTIDTIGASYNAVQSSSIVQAKEGTIKLANNEIISLMENKIISQINVDDQIDIQSNFTNNEIQINKYGNIKKAGTITIKAGKYQKNMIFSIGQGRYRVE